MTWLQDQNGEELGFHCCIDTLVSHIRFSCLSSYPLKPPSNYLDVHFLDPATCVLLSPWIFTRLTYATMPHTEAKKSSHDANWHERLVPRLSVGLE